MSKIFAYNFEKFSPKDIIEFLVKEGQEVVYQRGEPGVEEKGFKIKDKPILIRYPYLKDFGSPSFFELYSLAGDVKWNDLDKMYYTRDSTERGISGGKDKLLTKEHEKIFAKLKKLFAKKVMKKLQPLKTLTGCLM